MTPFPDLSGFPLWVQGLLAFVFLVAVGAGFGFSRLGYLWGKKGPLADNPAAATVAAVIVDPEPLKQLVAVGKELVTAITALGTAGTSHQDAQTQTAHDLGAAIGKLSDLLGQYIADAREERNEREIREAEERGAERERNRRRRSSPRRSSPARGAAE